MGGGDVDILVCSVQQPHAGRACLWNTGNTRLGDNLTEGKAIASVGKQIPVA